MTLVRYLGGICAVVLWAIIIIADVLLMMYSSPRLSIEVMPANKSCTFIERAIKRGAINHVDPNRC